MSLPSFERAVMSNSLGFGTLRIQEQSEMSAVSTDCSASLVSNSDTRVRSLRTLVQSLVASRLIHHWL